MDLRAIRDAAPVPDLATASPQRIDFRNARLDLDEDAARAVIAAGIDTAHHVAGDRSRSVGRGRGHKAWDLSDQAAEQTMREHILAGTVPLSYRLIATGDLLARIDRARHAIHEIEQERAGWTRSSAAGTAGPGSPPSLVDISTPDSGVWAARSARAPESGGTLS